MQAALSEKITGIGQKLDRLWDFLNIPRSDVPTVDEVLAEAASNPARLEEIQRLMQEAEFENPLIELT